MEIKKKISPPMRAERVPTGKELSKWEMALRRLKNIDGNLYRCWLYLQNTVLVAKYAQSAGYTIGSISEMSDLEPKFLTLNQEYHDIKYAMRLVSDREAGLRPNGSDDFDIVQPNESMAFPVVIAAITGTVLVIGLISRLIYLEIETQSLSEKMNSIMDSADKALCSDPKSPVCVGWENEKKKNDYVKNVTLADSVKNAVGVAGRGLGTGLLIAVPILAFLALRK